MSSGESGALSGDDFNLEEVAAAGRTLRDHVGEQISLTFADPVARVIATELAECLDEAGHADLAELARAAGGCA